MKWSLQHAYDNVPHYRNAFDQAGVHPDDLKSLADLAKFPFTGKKDLRDNYPFGLFAVPREQVVRVHASSGTTGKPTVVGYTQNDIDTWATVARSIRAAGGRRRHGADPTATACSPAAWARTTAPSGWAAPSSPCPAARPKSRCS
jgi:phenylacetate-CoA ligase